MRFTEDRHITPSSSVGSKQGWGQRHGTSSPRRSSSSRSSRTEIVVPADNRRPPDCPSPGATVPLSPYNRWPIRQGWRFRVSTLGHSGPPVNYSNYDVTQVTETSCRPAVTVMLNTHYRTDATQLLSWIASAVWTHPSEVVTQFTISCAVELFRLLTNLSISIKIHVVKPLCMESVWSVSKLSTEFIGSRRKLVANCVQTADADATQLDSASRRRCALGVTVTVSRACWCVNHLVSSDSSSLVVMYKHSSGSK